MKDLLPLIEAVIAAVDFDNNGAMIAGQFKGGNGGLLSIETIRAVDQLRLAVNTWKAQQPTPDELPRSPSAD